MGACSARTSDRRGRSAVLLIMLGLVLIGSALARGGGVLALGVVVGACFALAGAGRLWLLRGAPRRTAVSDARGRSGQALAGRARDELRRRSEFAGRAGGARARRAGALRDHAERGRGRALRDRRRGRRGRPRAHAGRVPRRRPVPRRHAAHLHRGKLAASRARRGVEHRQVRLQRVLELRRGLGDPARLHDRDGDRRDRHHPLHRRASGTAPTTGATQVAIVAALLRVRRSARTSAG